MKLNYFKTLFVAILVIFATTANAETYSGTCGTNVNWSLDTETGLLKITGTGAMTSYPWSSYKSSIKSVEIAEGVTSIGIWAFSYCSGLTSVTIPNSVTSIGNLAFFDCSGLTRVYITDLKAWCNIEFASYNANPLYYAHRLYLNGTLVRKLEIPEGVTAIKSLAFNGLNTIRSVTIPNSVTSIGTGAFQDCSELTSVTIPNSVTSIESAAFDGCSGLTSVTIGNSVTSIVDYAFENCGSLTEIYSLNPTPPVIKNNTFLNVPTTATLYVPASSKTAYQSTEYWSNFTNIQELASEGGEDKEEIFTYSGTCGDNLTWGLNAETGVLKIKGTGAMYDYNSGTSSSRPWYSYKSNIKSIEIADGVTSIGNYAFYGCSGLTSVTIGNSITSIGNYAFHNCRSLTSVIIPNSVTSIGNNAFYYCSALTSVTIGSGVSEIGEKAFYNCRKLDSIYSLAEYPPFIYSNTFYNVDKSIPVYIPKGTKEDYEFEWSDFTNFIESDFTGIEDSNISATEIKVIAGNGIDICNYYGKLQVINLAGQVIKDTYVNGSVQITLPKGMYIVVTNNNSQKVVL